MEKRTRRRVEVVIGNEGGCDSMCRRDENVYIYSEDYKFVDSTLFDISI